MHTSYQLKESNFAISLCGVGSTRDDVFPDWTSHDRVGIVVDKPFGGVGASLLLQVSITLFYDVCQKRKTEPFYPEVYLFHVGGRYGDHSSYDIYPPRKEVFVDDDPVAILEAINDRAITRLIVVDGEQGNPKHHFKEPASAKERLVSAFAYSPTGRVNSPDIEIEALKRCVIANTNMALRSGKKAYAELMESLSKSPKGPTLPVDEKHPVLVSRADEVSIEVRDSIIQQRDEISTNGLPLESYRRITVAQALNMLGSSGSRQ